MDAAIPSVQFGHALEELELRVVPEEGFVDLFLNLVPQARVQVFLGDVAPGQQGIDYCLTMARRLLVGLCDPVRRNCSAPNKSRQHPVEHGRAR